MIPLNRSDLFRVEIPKIFIPKTIKDKYSPYVFRMPTSIRNVSDLINYSIQSVTIPDFNYSPVEQVKPGGYIGDGKSRGTVRKWRNSLNPELLIDRSFTITFELLDGNINYWILLETFFHYYSFSNDEPFTFNIPIHIHDNEGNIMYSAIFKDVLFTGLSDFSLNYAEIAAEFRTFDAKFEFNEIDIEFPVQ